MAGATARADQVPPAEMRAGLPGLEALVERWRPRAVAVLGLTAFRVAFDRPRALVGEQPGGLGPSRLWLLPNPSGRSAHYQLPDLVRAYGELAAAVPP